MNPYIEINDYYSTPVSIGKEDLSWNLGIVVPLQEELYETGSIKIVVMDKDMFYDDVIGVGQFGYRDVLTRFRIDKLENMGREELRADIPIFNEQRKNKEQAVGHLKLHYRVH